MNSYGGIYLGDASVHDLSPNDMKIDEIGKREVWLLLNNIRSMNNRYLANLEEYFGDIRKVWDCSRAELDDTILSEKAKREIMICRNEDFLKNILFEAEKKKIKIMTIEDEEYPKNLRNIPDPPRVLYYKGNIKHDDSKSISVVGPREPSTYGIYAVQKLADELARYEITIVSGMASGIDTYAHIAALRRGSRTIAVLGTGADVIYPSHNSNLYWKIIGNGAVISEFPIGTKGFPYNFPKRNRIISGLSLGTLVIEAKERSGTLITCSHALEQGREVFAVPGNINSSYSHGTNRMIKEGAKLVESIEDIIEEIVELKELKEREEETGEIKQSIGYAENAIVDSLEKGPASIDEIIEKTGFGVVKVNGLITVLEMKGKIKRLQDGKLSRV